MTRTRLKLPIIGLALLALDGGTAQAQFAATRRAPGQPAPAAVNRSDPVAFTADQVTYDRETGIVTATGHVEAWQNDHVLQADKITFDRNTDIAAASGHVTVVEPDGQVLFSDYAELTQGMREGVLRGMRALLAQNGRLVANGARRTQGQINELSRAVYSTCNLCKKDPSRAPLWQLRARSALEDKEAKRIEYRDAVLDIYGVPVAFFPYFWHADPSVKRESGFLIPTFGEAKYLGGFLSIPYYQVLDDNSDATFTPTLSTKNYFNLDTQYRRRFNDGTLTVDTGIGYDRNQLGADVFAQGRFAYNETWRYGFDIDRATSANYLNDYRVSNRGDILTSRVYVEGFGTGAYTKLDGLAYQGLVASIQQNRLPYALPRYEYSYFGEPDAWGGRISFDTEDFNVLRDIGTNDQRLGSRLQYDRPFAGLFGERYKLTLRNDAEAYNATGLDQQPNFYTENNANSEQAQPNVALEVRWPWVREGGGTQTIEPILQFVGGPNPRGGVTHQKIPNEDSLDFEFTDQTLFQINKFPGIDREEGGLRLNAGLHLNWTAGGVALDNLIGQSYRSHKDDTFPVGSGLENRTSDIVTRTTLTPASWLDLTARTRLDHDSLNLRFADAVGSAGWDKFRVSSGYIYSANNPYFLYDNSTVPASYFQHRNEVTLGSMTKYDKYTLNAFVRRDLNLGKLDSAGVRVTYEDECFIFDANVSRRYTSLNGDNGATLVLFQVTFKTVGQFGYHAF